MTIVLVCGGRDYGWMTDPDTFERVINREEITALHDVLTDLHRNRRFTLLISGWNEKDEKGADYLAAQWANNASVLYQAYPADWARLKKSAGWVRNHQMLVEGRPNLVVAFKGGRGTKNMIDISRKAGVEVVTPNWEY